MKIWFVSHTRKLTDLKKRRGLRVHIPPFVYSKSEYTLESVSVSSRPAVRLHDNSLQLHLI